MTLGAVISLGGAFSLEDCWEGVGVEVCDRRRVEVEVSFLSDEGGGAERGIVGLGNSWWTILEVCQKCKKGGRVGEEDT